MGWRNRGQQGTALALLITFLASGIWHGASWGFLVWGGLHGCYLAASTYYRPHQKRLYQRLGVEKAWWLKYWQRFVTFHLVCLGWVFFRARSLTDALQVIANFLNFRASYQLALQSGMGKFVLSSILLDNGAFGVIFIAILLAVTHSIDLHHNRELIFGKPLWYRWSFYLAVVFATIVFKVSSNEFVYFQF